MRSIALDAWQNVWVATGSGVFMKPDGQKHWISMIPEVDKGPSFSIISAPDSAVWMSTWKGIYRYRKGKMESMEGTRAPIAVLASAAEGVYASGPHGVWLYSDAGCEKKKYSVARSVRDIISDHSGGLWMATDVGLYHATDNQVGHFYKPEHVVSAYIRGVATDAAGRLWAGGLGGISILDHEKKERMLRPEDGIPSMQVNVVERAPDGVMWVGTDVGIVRYRNDSSHSLLFSRRWLMDDKALAISFDVNGNAWVGTARGVSAIKKKKMTLAAKQNYFYGVLMRRHIRDPWIAGQCKLPIAGDTTRWEPDDDDNDGEYTGNYLAMESFRYAATKDPQARENARKAFGFLTLLREVTGQTGFFARTIVPVNWLQVDDPNRTFTERERQDELVKEPRFKPVEVRWHRSKDGKWMWKGDTSSDEMCGHMMGYFFYYELVADETDKEAVRRQVSAIVDHLIAHDFNLVDIDGTHTRWGVWSPARLNHDPEWTPDRSLNSMELLSFVKLAYYVTGQEKYQEAYMRLIREEGYLDNMANIPDQNPAWFIYFDVMLAAYQYPILLKCEKDPEIRAFYEKHLDAWFEKHRHDGNPLANFIYCFSRNKKAEMVSSVEFLKDTPLDLVDWPIDHTKREDVKIVRWPVLDDIQVSEVPPASIRGTIRWDKNPAGAISGNPSIEREPVFWLLPYWMGRYLGMIGP